MVSTALPDPQGYPSSEAGSLELHVCPSVTVLVPHPNTSIVSGGANLLILGVARRLFQQIVMSTSSNSEKHQLCFVLLVPGN